MAECEVSSSDPKGEEAATQEDSTSLVWMSSENQAVRRSQITTEEIKKLTVTCSSCGHQLNHHCSGELRIHKVLKVLVCKRCYSYYGDGDFKKDDTGVDEYCSWCAEGGNLIVCDSCTRAFCKKCVHRNLSRRELRRIGSLKEWQCYVCDPAPLAPMVNFADMVKKYSENVGHKAAQPGPPPMKMSEAELKKLALDQVDRIKQSVAELAMNEGNLSAVSKVLRDYSRNLARLAQGAEDCEKRQLRSRRKVEEKERRDSCPDSPASDSQSHRTRRRTRNKKSVAQDPECVVLSEPDEDGGDLQTKDLGEQASGKERGGNSEAEGTASKADDCRGEVAGPSAKMVNGETSNSGAKEDAGRASEEVKGSPAKLIAGVDKEKKDGGATAALEVPPVLSLGDEFSPLPPNGESENENESESLLAELYTSGANTTDEIVPETPPHKEQLNNAADKEEPAVKDQEKHSEEMLDAGNAADPGATLEATPGVSGSVENREDPSAGEGDGQRAGKKSSIDSSAENGPSTETVPSSREDDDNEPRTPQGTAIPRKKKRSPLSKNEKARRALMRSLRYSGESSSDDEFLDLSQSPRTHKPPKKDTARKRKRTSSSSSALIADCIEKAAEELNDPKLKMRLAVSLERLPLDASEVPMEGVEAHPSTDDEDKEIARLLTMPQKSRKAAKEEGESPDAKKKRGNLSRKPRKNKKIVSDGSNGDSEEDDSMQEENDGEKDEPAAAKTEKIPNLKEDLIQSILHSSSERSSGGEDSASPKKKLKKNTSEGKESDKEKAEEVRGEEEKQEDEPEEEEGEEEEEGGSGGRGSKKASKLSKYEKLLRSNPVDSDNSDSSVKGKSSGKSEEEPKKRKTTRKKKIIYSDDEDFVKDKSNSPPTSSDESLSEASSSDASFKAARKKKNKKGTKLGSDDEDFVSTKSKRGNSSASDANKRKKKRKRIKVACSTAEEDEDSDCIAVDGEGEGATSRKKIRKVISDKKLAQETKAAAHAEEERKKRIAERQKMYNEALGRGANADDLTVTQVVLEVDLKTKKPLVEVDQSLVGFMKRHQVKGVKFMYNCVIESLEMLKKDPIKGSGCVLAHCMGLGKTFQVISFLHTVMTHKVSGPLLRTAMVVCPYNTVRNWAAEFEHWLDENDLELKVFEISSIKVNYARADFLNRWQKKGGVLIIGYDMFRRLVNATGRGMKKLKEGFKRALLDPGPSIVICDEGHVLKNDVTNLSKAMSGLKTGRRIILTGTPLQNNLKEYHCMVNFVKPGLLGTKTEFLNRFVNPIANGQCADSTVHDVKLMKKRVHILHRLLDGCVQRCDYSALAPYLPPKYEYVISVRLSDVQVSLYRHFLEHLTRNAKGQQGLGGSLFNDHTMLRCIWTHPVLLRMSADRAAARDLLREEREEDESDMASFIDDDPVSDKSTPDTEDEDDVICVDKEAQSDKEGPSTRSKRRAKKKDDDESSGDEVITTWQTRSRGDGEERPQSPPKPPKKEWWDQFVSEEDIEKLQMSGKMTLLYNILQECDAIGDKVLLFSQSLLTLDMVEKMLEDCDERAQAVDPGTALVDPLDPFRDCHNSWVPGFDYFRMDGSTSVDMRTRWIEMFNDPKNLRGRLFLISTKAGSLGTNLVGANRVVLMDASWNPTHDVQAIFRVYRFGQKKPVFIYRLIAQGTMEEKIYDRQVTKQSLSCRVVDEQQIERHFKASDLQELYTFNPDSKSNRPTPMVPKDLLMAELLIRHKDWIVTYHEHDSLLQNIVDEDLTEEERKLAWEEYKDEREGRFKSTFENIQAEGSGQTFRLQLDLNKIIAEIKAKYPNMTSEMLVIQLRSVLMAYRNTFQQRQTAAFQKRAEFLKEKLLVPSEIIRDLTESGIAIQQLNQVLSKLQTQQFQPQYQQQQQQQYQQQQQQQRYQQQPPQYQYTYTRQGTGHAQAQFQQQQQAQYQQAQYQQAQARQQAWQQQQRQQQQRQQQQRQQQQRQQQAKPTMSQAQEIYARAYHQLLMQGATAQAAREYALKQQKLAFQQLLLQMGTSTSISTGPVISEVDDDAPPSASSAAPSSSSSSVVITEID